MIVLPNSPKVSLTLTTYNSFNIVHHNFIIKLLNHDFIAHPQSGMKASKIVLKLCSSEGSNLPYFLILDSKAVWLPRKWAMNLASNLEISDVTILSKYPLTPANITQTCSSATIGTYIKK